MIKVSSGNFEQDKSILMQKVIFIKMAVTKRTPKFRTNKIAMAYRDLLLDQAESKYKDAKIQGAYAEKSKLPSTGIIFF